VNTIASVTQNDKKVRVKWTKKEDELLIKYAEAFSGQWDKMTCIIPGKSGRQIEKRWVTKHDPKFIHRHWTLSEDEMIMALYRQFGGKWVKIGKHLPGRHSDAIKNRYYSVLRRRDEKVETKVESHSLPTLQV
jgi:hypothetical protein